MPKFKLLDGSHVVSNEPLTFANRGEIVESEVDLVAKFGSNKFELVEAPQEVAPKDEKGKKGAKAE